LLLFKETDVGEKAKVVKPVAPTEKQRAVLDACKSGRMVNLQETDGKKKLTVIGPTGKPAKVQPKLDRSALEGAHKKGWLEAVASESRPGGTVITTYKITEAGTKAKRVKPVTKVTTVV
jgi:hypothetical protein